MTLFTSYLAADWSAANRPVRGADSIWLATLRGGTIRTANIPTRNEALTAVERLCCEEKERGGRTLVGFDFAFGFPSGTAAALTGAASWRPVWRLLAELVSDSPSNASNRFEVGEELNRRLGAPRFWGKPHRPEGRFPDLPARPPKLHMQTGLREAERIVPGAKSVFQLAYAGAVGSQSLLGMAALEGLRKRTEALVWPFETGFAEHLTAQAVFCEIYPSLLLKHQEGVGIKDEAQVRAAVTIMQRFDGEGLIGELLGPPPGADSVAIEAMLREEGSIMGAGLLGVSGAA